MLTETAFEILRFFSRPELESLQMHSRFLRDFVNNRVEEVPLRRIYKISTHPRLGGGVHVWLEKDNEDSRFGVRELTDVNLGLLFGRLKNAFVERLEIDFDRSENIGRFMSHLRQHAAELKCRGKVLDVQPSYGVDISLGFVDTVAESLKPQAMRASITNAHTTPEALIFDHCSMRRVLRHVHFIVCGNGSEASCVVPGLLNVDTLETCGVASYEDVTPWIVRFANMFKTTKRGTKVVRTVAVVHSRGGDEAAPSADALIALGKPQRKDVQAPSSEFAKIIPSRHPPEETAYTESAAELFALTNTHLGKRLDVYKWTAEQRISDNSFPSIPEFPTTHFYDLYLLQIIDVQ